MDNSDSSSFTEEAKELAKSSQVLLIRHARSAYNQGNKTLRAQGASQIEFNKHSADPNLRDWLLSEIGVEETKLAAKTANCLKVHSVFVSPLRRTLQTAYNLFRTHPDFDKIKFIIVPEMREKYKATCDIPENTEEVIAEFKLKFNNFDTHYLMEETSAGRKCFKNLLKMVYDDSIFSSETLTSEQLTEENLVSILTKHIEDTYPLSWETIEKVRERAEIVKKIVAEYLKQNKLIPEDGDIENTPKIVLVAHNGFLLEYNNIQRTEEELRLDVSTIPNCWFFSDKTDYSSYFTSNVQL